MSESGPLANAFSKPANFSIREVIDPSLLAAVVPLPANLGPLAAFVEPSQVRDSTRFFGQIAQGPPRQCQDR